MCWYGAYNNDIYLRVQQVDICMPFSLVFTLDIYFFIIYVQDILILCLINALIFSHLNYCSSIWGKCSEKLQYEVQKCIKFAAKVASNGKYLK